MENKFKIAPSSKIGENHNVVGDKSTVSEQLFWQTLENKVKEITKDHPEKYEDVLAQSKEVLNFSSLTIIDTWFKIE